MAATRRRLTTAEIRERVRHPRLDLPEEPTATAVRYLEERRALEVTLPTAVAMIVPIALMPELEGVSPEILRTVRLDAGGWGVIWDALDAQYEVAGVLSLAV